MPEVSDRNLEKLERAVAGKQTPLLVMDRGLIRKKFDELRAGFGSARICYALKTNPHWRIVDLLHKLGSDFEISSREELDLLLRRGIPADRIIASNPVKSDDCIRAAFADRKSTRLNSSHIPLPRMPSSA